jgi:deoxyguanosine kinase
MTGRPLIQFEGPIAAGKTTLATMLSQHSGSELILEDFEGNEFLADFYHSRERWSLAMQLSFLTSRHAQLRTVIRPLSRTVVVDYSYLKDGIFARILLQGRELRLFEQVLAGFRPNVARPDLIVYLDGTNEVLLERIRKRNRRYEAVIDGGYLDTLRRAYEKDLLSSSDENVLRYDTSRLNLASEAEMNSLYQTIVAGLPNQPQ